MSSLVTGLRRLRLQGQLPAAQWPKTALPRLAIPLGTRGLNTDTTSGTESGATNSQAIEALSAANNAQLPKAVRSIQIPFQQVTHARAIPASPSYYSRDPKFNDLYVRISNLLTKYAHLPRVKTAPPTAWIKLDEMRTKLGEPIKAAHFATVRRVASRLNKIDPSSMPEEVKLAIAEFTRSINPFSNARKPGHLDRVGRASGVGRRKESTATARIVEGEGEVLINGKTLNQFFGRVHDRESAMWALQATGRLDKYNVWVSVKGGGTTGQAEATTLAIAHALIVHEPALKTALKRAGCITRDPRAVERKKHGHVKARKMPAWVKR